MFVFSINYFLLTYARNIGVHTHLVLCPYDLPNSQLGRADDALADFTRAIALSPQAVLSYMARAQLLERVARHRDALRDLDQALQLHPGHVAALRSRGWCYRALGQYREVVKDLSR